MIMSQTVVLPDAAPPATPANNESITTKRDFVNTQFVTKHHSEYKKQT